MTLKYQLVDLNFVDYKLYRLPGIIGEFRGPQVLSDKYVACVGAAQTFGRFVETPFPSILASRLGIETLNLGRGSASPTYPLSNPILLETINRAQAVIVQVLSGRSQSNSLFKIVNHGMRGINQATGCEQTAPEFYTWLLNQDKQLVREIVDETRRNYDRAMVELLDAIKPPKILLWFSKRSPDSKEELSFPLHRLFGEFPQFVNRATVDLLRGHCNAYVECVSRRGLPQPLFDRGRGPVLFEGTALPPPEGILLKENVYYPSPEMHEEAAALLMPECRAILDGKLGNTGVSPNP